MMSLLKKMRKINVGSVCFSFTSPCCSNVRYQNVANFSFMISKSRVCIFNWGGGFNINKNAFLLGSLFSFEEML